MADPRADRFQEAARAALDSPGVQQALHRLDHFRVGRARALDEMGPEAWRVLQERGRQVRRHTLEHLDYYLDLLARNVERAGGHVFFARDDREANEYVTGVARTHGVKTVIKGKSMVAEEMGVAAALEAMGVEAVETDLGEYIIQLAGEPPFHIIAPALHKSKEEVARLFAEKLGLEPQSDIGALAGQARRVLRERFLRADMGMTGVNFAVAESGTVVVVTNEGNGRMCTSLPRVHIATMGMERVLPRLEDLATFLPLLTRSATGQRITSYVTMATGPRRSDEEDGPEEFHLVVLDNGRSRLLADPELREVLYCIRCGACLAACPVYSHIGGHAYGWVYPGPIGAVVTPALLGLDKARDLPYASTLCGACRDVCPLSIDIPRMLLKHRRDLAEGRQGGGGGARERAAMGLWRRAVGGPRAFRLAGLAARIVQWKLSVARPWGVRWLPPPLSGWTATRDLPQVAWRPFRARWPGHSPGPKLGSE